MPEGFLAEEYLGVAAGPKSQLNTAKESKLPDAIKLKLLPERH